MSSSSLRSSSRIHSYPFQSIYELFNKYRTEIIIVITIIIFLYLFFFDRKKEHKYTGLPSNHTVKNNKKKFTISKGEQKCKEIVEKYYNLPFKKVRPAFLKYKNGKNLELDCYNPELKLAIEYNGRQHREFCPFFHKTISDFHDQLDRDKFKKEQCINNGIRLIIIDDTIKYNDLEKYLVNILSDNPKELSNNDFNKSDNNENSNIRNGVETNNQ